MVLKELTVADMTGYELMKCLSYLLGSKPSAGSLYPLLTELKKQGMVSMKEDGRKRIYSITQKGRKLAVAILKEKQELVLKHLELLHTCKERHPKVTEDFLAMMIQLRARADAMLPNLDVWIDMRSAVISIATTPDYKSKEGEVRKVLEEAVGKLRSIRRGPSG